jgi:hypothetical protein
LWEGFVRCLLLSMVFLAICSVVLWDETDECFFVFVERIDGLSTVGEASCV